MRNEAKVQHQNETEKETTWSHAKKNTMKLFFCDRDEDLPSSERLESFINFIKQMSHKKRQFNKSLKERVLKIF